MFTEQDEGQLTSAACHGSVEAFEVLMTRYEPRIRRLIYHLTHDHHMAQDLCQETFLAAYRALPHTRGRELHFSPWLSRIALNQVRNEWRRRKSVTWVSFSSLQGDGTGRGREPGEGNLESPDHFERQVEQRDLIADALTRLPGHYVACLLLDAEGFSYHEISAIVRASKPAIRGRLSRARRAFRQIYAQLDQQQPPPSGLAKERTHREARGKT